MSTRRVPAEAPFQPRLVARTRRLVVRPLTFADYDLWLRAMTERGPSQSEFDPAPRPPHQRTRRFFRGLVAGHYRAQADDLHYLFGLFHRKDGLVGTVGVTVVGRWMVQLGWLGYHVYNQHWGKGYGSEGVGAVIRLVFRELRLHRVEAGIQRDNRASLRLARAVGMRKEGAPRGAVWIDGAWRDLLVYAVNSEDLGIRVIPSVRLAKLR